MMAAAARSSGLTWLAQVAVTFDSALGAIYG